MILSFESIFSVEEIPPYALNHLGYNCFIVCLVILESTSAYSSKSKKIVCKIWI